MEEILEGAIIWGRAGSGKTSGAGAHLLDAKLKHKSRPGGLSLCVKADERIRLERAIEAAGRTDDLVIIDKYSPWQMNGLAYLLDKFRDGEISYDTTVDFLMNLFFLAENNQAGGASGGEQERFWDKSLRRMLARCIMLLHLAEYELSIYNLYQLLIHSLNEDEIFRFIELMEIIEMEVNTEKDEARLAEALDIYEAWKAKNLLLQAWDTANTRQNLTDEEYRTLGLVRDYFFVQWPKVSEKTRAIVEESALGMYEPFLTGVLHSHFSKRMDDELRPERCYEEGTIFLVDISIKEHGLSAVFANGIAKLIFQNCMERRIIENEENPRMTFLWCDEYHYFVSPDSDIKFMSSCRSVMTSATYITQSYSGLKAAMGKDGDTKIKALLTNLNCQYFCANMDRETNEHAANLIGKEFKKMGSTSVDTNNKGSQSYREELQYRVQPEDFSSGKMRTGGKKHKYKVDAVLVVSGKKWKSGEPYLECTFDQRGNRPSILKRILYFFKSLF